MLYTRWIEPIRFHIENHYHVRCVKCGEVSDVDMDEMQGEEVYL